MTLLSSLPARLSLAVGLTTLLVSLAISPASAAAASQTLSTARAACGLPLVHDTYAGFHIGVPAGWDVSTFNGAISVSKDAMGTEMGLVYPALLTKGLTPAGFFAAASKAVQQIATTAGNAITFHLTSKPGQLPQASVTGRDGRVVEQGHATVLVVPAQTALATEQVVFSLYWAPPARLAADAALLSHIGQCYGPEAGTLYQMYQDQAFAASLPIGWQVASEGQDYLDLTGDANRALASYLLTMVPPSAGATTARSLLQYVATQTHIQIDHILSSTDAPTQQIAGGATQSQEIVEFTGQYNGKAVHGIVSVLCDAGSVGSTGVLRLGMATADQWNAVNSGLIRVVGSIQHNFAQDQAQINHINQQQQQFDQNEQQFDNVINNVQDVEDMSTGTIYQAPYDSYNPNGPNGPGYYLDKDGTLVQLQEVNHQ